MLEIGDRFARRLGHQSPRLLSWTCTKQPQQRTYDAFFKNIKLYVSATLRPIEVELGQPCISTLLPFEDRTVPTLDEVARDIILAQFDPDPLPSGGNVGNSRGECAMVSSGGGSEDDDDSGENEDEGVLEETGGDKSGDSNGEASDEGDREDNHTRQTSGASLTRDEVEELLLDQRMLIEIRMRTVKLEIMQHVTDEFVKVRDIISTLVPPALSRSTPPTAQAANELTVLATSVHVHGRGFSSLSVDHDEDMDKEMQERNGRAGRESEPALNGDDGNVASGGSGKREDDGVASPTGVTEADGGRSMDFEPEKSCHDDEVSSGSSGNLLDKLVASASSVAEVDGGTTNVPGKASIPVLCNDPPTTKRRRSTRVRRPAESEEISRRILLFQLIPWNLYTSRLNPFSNPYPRIRKSFNSVSDATCEVPLFKDRAIFAKGFFNKLISFPLDDLVDPKHETATIESLSILRDNLSLFSDEQAKEIMSLKANFPSTIQDWRDSVQVKVSGEHIWSTFEKTNNLPEDLVKTEEGVKTELEELKNRENDREMQLEGLKSKIDK
ncbi:Hypothetical predicted protein [Olea europaea subsp. europaea]|uniref:Uncharacterized protein n=1 Tax=Olea europaea subsp. europaea TaxID=158383 RepID=A0A8S0T805_OLEEU|nr:Hypothetical predicted protein [Olea europaea subsp. europaea]